MRSGNEVGAVYYCPVCMAELSVIKSGSGEPGPYCCNVPMKLTDIVHERFYCKVCGGELMVIKNDPEKGDLRERLKPYCCNEPMHFAA